MAYFQGRHLAIFTHTQLLASALFNKNGTETEKNITTERSDLVTIHVLYTKAQTNIQTNIRFAKYSDTKIGNQLFVCCFQWCVLNKFSKISANTVRGKILEWEKIGKFGELWSLRQYFTRQ